MRVRASLFLELGLLLASACGAAPAAPPPADGTGAAGAPGPHAASAGSQTHAGPPAIAAPTPAEAFAILRAPLDACYRKGLAAIPAMKSGKITLLATFDAGGATCVVPAEDTGLTQDVEDCMTAAVTATRWSAKGRWSLELALSVSDGVVGLAPPKSSTTAAIDTVEVHQMPDPHDVLERLLPELQACFAPLAQTDRLRVVHVGARIASDGSVACALAASAPPLPTAVASCATGAVERARFPRPTKGVGLVTIPLKLVGSR